MSVFPKRLRKLPQKVQADLHQNGQVVFHYPYKVHCLIRPTPTSSRSECRIIVSVPKRNFKRAVDRNRIKRQMREVFRLNANRLNQKLTAHNKHIELLCLYLPHEHTHSAILSHKMESLLVRLGQLVALDTPPSAVGVD